jgi:hypothetical protein
MRWLCLALLGFHYDARCGLDVRRMLLLLLLLQVSQAIAA